MLHLLFTEGSRKLKTKSCMQICRQLFLLKENLISDGQQYHQYQQKEQSLNINKAMTYDIWNPGPGLRQAQRCGGVKQVKGMPTLTSW